MRDLGPLVAPRSVAVIGASASAAKSGGILFKNIADGGYPGRLHPINPRAGEILGRRAYPRIGDVPEPVDLVFIVLPRAGVRDAVAECVAAGARSACIITAGFAEIGADGRRLQEDLAAMARTGGLLLIGPNTIGTVNAEARLMGSFVPFPSWRSGGVSILAQTGIFTGAAMLQHMSQPHQRIGVGKSIDVGNKVDVDEVDFLRYAGEDPATRVIGLHLEGIADPAAFFSLAARVAAQKPIVLLRPGRTPAGAAASAFHTGAAPTGDAGLDRALRQHGVVRAEDEEDFLGYLKAFSYLPRPRGPRVAVATYSGALGVLAADALTAAGLPLATLGPDTVERIGTVVPDWSPILDPCDLWVAIDTVGGRDAHAVPLAAILEDPGVDMVLALILTPANADFPDVSAVFGDLRARHPDVPLALVLVGGAVRERWLQEIDGLDIPAFPTVRAAVRALRALAEHAAWTRGEGR